VASAIGESHSGKFDNVAKKFPWRTFGQKTNESFCSQIQAGESAEIYF
jgi:hypothetical protein